MTPTEDAHVEETPEPATHDESHEPTLDELVANLVPGVEVPESEPIPEESTEETPAPVQEEEPVPDPAMIGMKVKIFDQHTIGVE